MFVTFFDGVPSKGREALVRSARHRLFRPGQTLFERGDTPRDVFGLVSGHVKVWRTSREGAALTLLLVGRGDVVGALAVAHGTVHPVTATAFGPVECEAWPAALFLTALESDAVLAARVLHLVAGRAEQLIDRLEEIAAVPLEQRLARILLRLAADCGRDGGSHIVGLPFTRQDFADLASVTLPTVSRIMSRWTRAGMIGGRRGEVRILDLNRLTMLADLVNAS